MFTGVQVRGIPLVKLSRPNAFIIALVAALLFPLAIPQVGIDYPYFFIFVITLMAWFIMKWDAFESLTSKGTTWEFALAEGLS